MAWDVRGVNDRYTGPFAHLVLLAVLIAVCLAVGMGVRLVGGWRRERR